MRSAFRERAIRDECDIPLSDLARYDENAWIETMHLCNESVDIGVQLYPQKAYAWVVGRQLSLSRDLLALCAYSRAGWSGRSLEMFSRESLRWVRTRNAAT
jgi:hypothetical protein